MKARSSWRTRWCRMPRRPSKSARAAWPIMVWLGFLPALSAAPDWLQAAAREPLSPYPDNPAAVMLLNEQIVTVKNDNEVTTVYRHAYRILRPEGRRYGVVQIYFDSETRITFLKGWS